MGLEASEVALITHTHTEMEREIRGCDQSLTYLK